MRYTWIRAASLLGSLGCVAALSCSSSADDTASACASESVDRFKELVIVEEPVLADARSKNATSGPWSFRHVFENLAPSGMDPGEFARGWLNQWTLKELNGVKLDREPRDGEMNRRILCPWLHATPANACSDTCSTCDTFKLELAKAPFHLIAIVNRIDLREEVADEPNGEARLVFGLTDGPGDDPGSRALPMTVVVEYALPETKSAQEWAQAWHDLGKIPAFDEPYRAALEKITRAFTTRGSRPKESNGSALEQIRTNESALNWIWQLREFGLAADGNLRLRPMRNTPFEALNNTVALKDHVVQNRDAILSKKYEMAEGIRAGAADQLLYSWAIPGVDEPLRKAFAGGTCNGCHSTENPNIDTAFHISPFRKGVAKVSPFLHDPAQARPDELTLRVQSTQRALCGR